MNLLLYAQIGQEVINKYKILSDDNSAEIGSLRMISAGIRSYLGVDDSNISISSTN
jgi:hypothetical protein